MKILIPLSKIEKHKTDYILISLVSTLMYNKFSFERVIRPSHEPIKSPNKFKSMEYPLQNYFLSSMIVSMVNCMGIRYPRLLIVRWQIAINHRT